MKQSGRDILTLKLILLYLQMTFLRFHLISWQLFHGSGFAGLECFDWTPPGVCARYLKFKCRTIDEDIYQLSSVDTSYDEGVF